VTVLEICPGVSSFIFTWLVPLIQCSPHCSFPLLHFIFLFLSLTIPSFKRLSFLALRCSRACEIDRMGWSIAVEIVIFLRALQIWFIYLSVVCLIQLSFLLQQFSFSFYARLQHHSDAAKLSYAMIHRGKQLYI